MKKYLSTVIAGMLFVGTTAFADILHHCEPAEPSKQIRWIQISADRTGSERFAISWTSRDGRGNIEVTAAEQVDDFTVAGYSSVKMNAALLFYTEDDSGGERSVLELGGKEISVVCKGRN